MWLVLTISKLSPLISQEKTEDSINSSHQAFTTYLLSASHYAIHCGRDRDEKDTALIFEDPSQTRGNKLVNNKPPCEAE